MELAALISFSFSPDSIKQLEPFCSEFLIHAADNEGFQCGIDERLVEKLGQWCTIPVTYAGGGKSVDDLERVRELSAGRVDLTIGSALDIFGGKGVLFKDCVAWNNKQEDIRARTKSRITSYELDMINNLVHYEKLQEDTPVDKLKRYLSIKSVMSTTSSFAERQEAAAEAASQTYRQIGVGTCGKIFEQTGTTKIFKQAIADNGALWNDYKMHTHVSESFSNFDLEIMIPKVYYFVGPRDHDWWEEHGENFPDAVSRKILCAERILPLPKIIREAVIDTYCPSQAVTTAKKDKANRDCLIRLYLGRRRDQSMRPSRFFTLRNYNLTLDQMEDLDLDTSSFAIVMADALAGMHWLCGIDADDVEFVLGSAPTSTDRIRPLSKREVWNLPEDSSTVAQTTNSISFKVRTVHLWLLDFDRCKEITRDIAGVEQAAQAFLRNDPYYPRPLAALTRDQSLWKTFRDRYMQKSSEFLEGTLEIGLAGKFIQRVVELQQQRLNQRAKES